MINRTLDDNLFDDVDVFASLAVVKNILLLLCIYACITI